MFENGSEFVCFDCHLHTKKDKEFIFEGEDDKFIKEYVDKLDEEKINIGVITNHNKFDLYEYKTLKKVARKKDILILPGVELSVKEGASGVHILIVFKPDDWISGDIDYISRMISSFFLNIPDPGNENTCTNKDLMGVISELDKASKEYFIIFAHVEQNKGFFKECKGTLIESLSKNEAFKKRVLGFQKGRTYDLMKKVHDWMGYDIAYVEGSDPKKIEDIGKGDRKTYVKIGDLTYDALLFALKDYEHRVFPDIPKINHGYIKRMRCIGGKLNGQVFSPSNELNTLIGIRGSGKSSVIEVLRYALGINETTDPEYKRSLVQTVLGPGGEVELEIIDKNSHKYRISRILNEMPTIHDEFNNVLNISVETILNNPLYFGQKDLALTKKGYELELLNKIIGNGIEDNSREIEEIKKRLNSNIEKYISVSDIPQKIEDIKTENIELEHKLQIFSEKGIDEKLKKITACNNDLIKINSVLNHTNSLYNSIKNAYTEKETDLINLSNYSSEYNGEIFDEARNISEKVLTTLNEIDIAIGKMGELVTKLEKTKEKLENKIDSLKEEFASIKREINDDNLDVESFVNYKKRMSSNTEKIDQLTKTLKQKDEISSIIKDDFNSRNNLLEKRFDKYKEAIKKINESQDQLQVDIEYKGNKNKFKDDLQEQFRGSGLTENRYSEISKSFSDFAEIVEDYFLNEGKNIVKYCTENIYAKVSNKIIQSYKDMISLDCSNTITIRYHDKLLSKHSLGERASALILFILTQHDSDVIIIDQPEDDLDNQVIYKELIRTILQEKKNMQFIFATHNANIPVLGDAERVVTAEYDGDNEMIKLKQGTIDSTDIHDAIVDIMEGGTEAFNKRNEIYNAWK